jgi:hypothetical protein
LFTTSTASAPSDGKAAIAVKAADDFKNARRLT